VDEVEDLATRDGYDRWAEIYDGEDNPLILLEQRALPGLLGDVRGLQVVDLGCGTGRVSFRLLEAGAQVTALDFSEGMLAAARMRPGADRIRFMSHDLGRPLPFDNEAFDRVVSCLVLEHLQQLDPFFAEMRRVCRANGSVIVTAMHPAMMLRGVQARFHDPASGRVVRPKSWPNQISDFVMAAVRAGLSIESMIEHAVDESLAAASPRAIKHLGWPLLIAMRLKPNRV
jgi:ubiquinone/menaquinone biosynthesis C-methylase UbiE